MKVYYKIYLFYTGIFLIGASLSAGIYFAYGASVFPTDVFKCGTGFDIRSFTSPASALLLPLFLMFLSGFTVYSCFISSVSCIYVGSILGRIAIMYGLSDHSFFTHGAILVLLAIFASVFVITAKEAAVCRSTIATAAPIPAELMRSRVASSFFKTFTSSIIAVIASCFALYLLLIYFPV